MCVIHKEIPRKVVQWYFIFGSNFFLKRPTRPKLTFLTDIIIFQKGNARRDYLLKLSFHKRQV